MSPKNLGTIPSFSIHGKTIFAISDDWKKFLGDTLTFEAVIDKNGRYTMVGPVVHREHLSDTTDVQEDVTDE